MTTPTPTPTLSCASIDRLLFSLTSRGASDHTVRAYGSDLKMLLSWLESNESSNPLETRVAQYLTAHRKHWKPKTTLRKLTAIRSWARSEGDPDFLKDYRAPTPAKQEPHPVAEGMAGIDRMLEIARTPSKKALVALCGLCGLRISEACSVQVVDIDVSRLLLRVRGKGDKTRYVPISKRAWEFIQPAVLDAALSGSTVVGVQERSARASITSLARRARLRQRVASHDLRATFATTALEKTMDLRAVQELLGHASVVTTQVYTSVSETRMREAVEAL